MRKSSLLIFFLGTNHNILKYIILKSLNKNMKIKEEDTNV